MHIIGWGSAPFIELISLNKWSRKRVVLLKFEIAWSFIVAESTSDCQILWASIKNNSGWLRNRWSHVHSAHINSIVTTIKRHLKSDIVFLVLTLISNFRYQLFGMSFLSILWIFSKISNYICLNLSFCINIKVLSSLEKAIWLLLHFRKWFAYIGFLHFSQLGICMVFDLYLAIHCVWFF